MRVVLGLWIGSETAEGVEVVAAIGCHVYGRTAIDGIGVLLGCGT